MEYPVYIPAVLQIRWNLWNIRGFMILSLCMQLVLTLAAPFRQKTSSRFITFVVWSSYLLADWAVLFVFGLISNAGNGIAENRDAGVPSNITVLWAAFLLVHLGGPDTITAFSLEDNALWHRHLIGLVSQLFVFQYIFVKTLPNIRLVGPTVLIFVAGVINYGERTRALYLASLENLKKTRKDTIDLNSVKDEEFFQHLAKVLASDIMLNLDECNKSRCLISGYSPKDIFTSIKSLLDILYELLYTKVKAATSGWGIVARGISYYSTQVAFILFCLADKNGFHGVDLAITYALFVGVFILDVANVMLLATTDLQNISGNEFIRLALKQGIFLGLIAIALVFVMLIILPDSALKYLFERTWSEKMGSFNMLSQCFTQCVPRRGRKLGFIWNKLAGERHTSREDFDDKLWNHVCEDIKRKAAGPLDAAGVRKLYDARGDRALEESGCDELMPYIGDFEYENTLVIWHIATEICISIEGAEDDDADRKTKKIFSKKLSDYMMHLLVRQQKLMSPVAGISHIRYKDTRAELELLRRNCRARNMRQFCESILNEPVNIVEPAKEGNNHKHSVLNDSYELVRLLRKRNNRWEVISKVWLELLSYAAGHCRVESHLRLLSEGSEFLTMVWMLMAFWGIRDQFPVRRSTKEDNEQTTENPPTDLTEGEEDIQQEIIGPHDVPSGEAIRDQFPVERSSKGDDDEEIGEPSTDFTKGEEDI